MALQDRTVSGLGLISGLYIREKIFTATHIGVDFWLGYYKINLCNIGNHLF